MNIIITGSRGFIGGHLMKNLKADKHKIVEWDLKIDKDIRDFNTKIRWATDKVDFVIHLAAFADVRRSIEHPDEYWVNNVEYTTNIQRLCHEQNIPLLYASSSCIHQWHKSPYGISKKVNEETAIGYNQIGLRFTTVYGEGARESMFMGKLMRGDLPYATTHVRDFVHVDDVIRAIRLIMNQFSEHPRWALHKRPRAYDIGTGVGHVVKDLAHLVNAEIPVQDGFPCEAQDNTADTAEIRNIGWLPSINAKNYLEQFIDGRTI